MTKKQKVSTARKLYLREWRSRNKAKISAYTKSWVLENKDKVNGYRLARKDRPYSYKKRDSEKDKIKRKATNKAWNLANRDKKKITKKKWDLANKDRRREYSRSWQLVNKSRRSSVRKAWRTANKGKCTSYCAKRRAKKIQATPAWLTKEQLKQIQDFYILAKNLVLTTGIQYHVDHIVPLRGKDVSGLHVPWNLQVLTAHENINKSNKILTTYSQLTTKNKENL